MVCQPEVTRVLEQMVAKRRQPSAIRCDNGLELTSPGISWRGAWSGTSSWFTFSRGSRRRTRTDGCGTSVWQ